MTMTAVCRSTWASRLMVCASLDSLMFCLLGSVFRIFRATSRAVEKSRFCLAVWLLMCS